MDERLKMPLGLISGLYSNELWDNLCNLFENASSMIYVYDTLRILHDINRNQEAFNLVQILYELSGLDMPKEVAELNNKEVNQMAYIAELLLDIENMM